MIAQPIDSALSTVLAAFAALPTHKHISALIEDSLAAEARGYFKPSEDERLRETYTRYLAIRSALWEVIQALPLPAKRVQRQPESATQADWCGFSIAFCAAEMIVRTGEHLIDLARERPLVWRKLDEADKRYDLKRKSFTRVYRQLTSAFLMRGFYRACETYDTHREKADSAAPPEISQILESLDLPTVSRGKHLLRYRRFFRHSLKRRQMSAGRNIVFSVFEMMGSDIADLKIPFVKPPRAPKRVTPKTIESIRKVLRPGDVFVTRHDDAMSNVFLPGFWRILPYGLARRMQIFLRLKKTGSCFGILKRRCRSMLLQSSGLSLMAQTFQRHFRVPVRMSENYMISFLIFGPRTALCAQKLSTGPIMRLAPLILN